MSPVYKEGFPVREIYAISADGSRMIGGSFAVLSGQENNEINNGNLAPDEFTRTGSGWTATPLSPSSLQFNYHAFTSFTSTDLTRALWELNEPSESAYALDLFVREPGGSFVKVGPLVPPSVASSGPPSSPGQPTFRIPISVVGASSDLSRILFASHFAAKGEPDVRWPGDTTALRMGAYSLYEYAGTGNSRPELVGVGQGGSLISTCSTVLGGEGSKYNAVASDGETVFFTSFAQQSAKLGDPGCTGPAVDEIYARVGRSGPVPISEPTQAQCSNCLTGHTVPNTVTESSASFQGASVDGSKVFFTTEQELFAGQKTENLYEYDFDNSLLEKVLLVSRGSLTPEVKGVTQISQDGSHVYFVAGGVLSGANGEGRSPVAGQNNMYVFERDSSYPLGRIAFVATLAAGDSADWQIGFGGPDQATPDGRFLVFSSKADLTSDDSSTVAQLFEYDAREEKLVRISIGQCPNGLVTCMSSERFNSDGNILGTAAFAPLMGSPGYESGDLPTGRESALSVSDDGAYVFFRSSDGLTENALNRDLISVYEGAKRYANNVYEYHSNVAAAGGSIAAGNVSLISDGQDVATGENGLSIVHFLGTDASGGDAFFQTADSLVAQDSDTALDVYDARLGGGFPAPVAPSQCAGEACQGGLSSTPSFGSSPGSATTVGGDNLSAVAAPTIASPVRGVTSRPRVLTRAQKLRNALRTCRKDRSRRKRAVCEARAQKRYGGSNGTSGGKSGGRSGK